MNEQAQPVAISATAAAAVRKESHADVLSCYQCGKCTNGCPVTFAMDEMPHAVIRMLQLGLTDEAARLKTPWLCASCETCVTRCPNRVDIPRIMDYLKQRALGAGILPEDREILAFHRTFLENIATFGRINELFLMGSFQMKTAFGEKGFDLDAVLSNLKLGAKLMKTGRIGLHLLPAAGKARIKKYFE
ncbi:MAG: 4Fe-4S dicluster domain-containing protein [Thermodesulfobacteriota bacterium]